MTTDQAQAAADTVERVIGNGLTIAGGDLRTDHARRAARLGLPNEAPGGGNWQIVIERDPIQQFVGRLRAPDRRRGDERDVQVQ